MNIFILFCIWRLEGEKCPATHIPPPVPPPLMECRFSVLYSNWALSQNIDNSYYDVLVLLLYSLLTGVQCIE